MGRPVTVNVGPLASADDDGISTSQKAAGAQYLVLQGALTNGTTANNVCLSQTPSGAANLVLNGAICSAVPTGSAVAYLGANNRIYITSGSDISNRTFTITGLYQSVSGLSSQTETLTGPNASTVASQKTYYSISSIAISGAAAGALTVGRAGIATLMTVGSGLARRVIVTSGGNDTGITFTLAGTDWFGSPISEVITGASGAAASSVLSYQTVTSVLTSGAVATTVIVGTNTVADSSWVRFDDYAAMAQVAIQATVSGTVSYTISQTLQDPNASYPDAVAPASMIWVNHPDAAFVAAIATAQGNYAYTPAYARVTLNSGTGSVSTVFRQSYLL